jgi:ABC-type taurine transport system ATPase subunit
MANSPTSLALKRLILQHKPDFIFVSEPWMSIDALPRRWLSNLQLKAFACNDRNNLLPNLWCICSLSLNSLILASDD